MPRQGKSMKLKFFLAVVIFLSLFSLPSFAETFKPLDQRWIATGQNANWYYIGIHKVHETAYIGIDKNDRGAIGVGVKPNTGSLEMFGRMWLVPAFNHPSNSKWYLCPIKGVSTVHEVNDLGDGWWFNASDSALTCYRYDDTSLTGTVDINIEFSIETDSSAKTKINANVTVSGVSPTDTGFGFFFRPNNIAKYRYVYIDGQWRDLAGVEGSIPVQKVFKFFNENQKEIGHLFDWTDMLDVGSQFSSIITLGQKGLLVGTYGYGASNTIEIDPMYQVDYSPIPAEHQINGTATASGDDFENITDITSGVSDDSDATEYDTFEYNIHGDYFVFNFDETSGTTIREATGSGYDLTAVNNPDLTITGVSGTGIRFNGINQSLYHVYNDFYDIHDDEDFLFCISFNVSSASSGGTMIIYRNSNNLEYYELETLNNGKQKIMYKRAGGSLGTIASTTPYADGTWHSLCIWNDVDTGDLEMFVDGVSEGTSTVATYDNISSDQNFVIGAGYGSGYYDGDLDELCAWRGNITNYTYLIEKYEQHYCGNYSQARAIIGKWNQTYDSNYEWFLRLRKTSDGEDIVTVYPYINDTHINTTLYVSKVLSGIGWFNINVSTLMDYQTNVLALNYTSLRFFSHNPHNFSEIRLRKEANDTESPTILDCQIDDVNLSESETARLKCNITDDVDVDKVNFTISSTVYETTKNNSWCYYDFDCLVNGTYNWTLVEAWDIVDNYNSSTPNLAFDCIIPDAPPTSGNNSTNSTGTGCENVEFRLNWQDDDGLSGYIFSINNGTGSYVNDTWTAFQSGDCPFPYTNCWSNVTKQVNCTNATICWKYFVNDTVDNWVSSDEYCFNVTEPILDTDLNVTYEAGIQVEGIYDIIINYTYGGEHIPNATVWLCWEASPLECVVCNESNLYYYFNYTYDGTGGIVFFTVNASKTGYETLYYNFSIHFFDSFLGIRFWENLNMTEHYFNEFLWVYARPKCSLWDRWAYLGLWHTCNETHYHAEYIEGVANLTLWAGMTYELWVLESGAVQWECFTCPPNVTSFDNWVMFDEVTIDVSGIYTADYFWNTTVEGQYPIFDTPEWNFWLSVIGIVILFLTVILVAYFTQNGVAVFLAMIIMYILLKLFNVLTGAIFFGFF